MVQNVWNIMQPIPKIINQSFISSHSILKHFIIQDAGNALKESMHRNLRKEKVLRAQDSKDIKGH